MKKTIQYFIERVRAYVVTILATLGLTLTINAHAGQIDFALPFGPGFGPDGPLFEENYVFDGVGENEFIYIKVFEDVDYIDLIMIIEDDGLTNQVIIDELIVNDTGIDWTDYHLELGFVLPDFDSDEIAYEFLTINSELKFNEFEQFGPFSSETVMPDEENFNTIWLDDGILPDAEIFGLSVEFDLPDFNPATMPAGAMFLEDDDDDDDDGQGYIIALRQIPTTAVPEPSIIALFAAGLLGLGIARRRMRS